MSLSSLQVLADNRNALLLAEVAALLHDVGKFCDLHIEAEGIGGARKWANDHAYKAVLDNPAEVIRLSKAVANKPKPDVINHVLSAGSPKIADFLPPAFKDALKQTPVALQGESYTLAELVMLSTPGFAAHQNRSQLFDDKDAWLPAALGVCHHEAHHDKQEPGDNSGQQNFTATFISTPFGIEKDIVTISDPQNSLDARLQSLPITVASLSNPRSVGGRVLQEFERGLGDTRRSINEVTLADWAWTVAALFKPAMAFVLLKSQKPEIRQWLSWKNKILNHDIRWRLLRVNFDVLGLYAKAIKIADLLGYQQAVSDACAAVKQLAEEEYPLGNEVYRDTTGIYFTYPDLDLFPELTQEIRRRVEAIEPELAPHIVVDPSEPLKTLLSSSHNKARQELAQPMMSENLSLDWQMQWDNLPDGKWELCPVCRLRPMRNKEEACEHCEGRRQSRIELWERDPSKTIWLDEIADHNDRVALIIGKFGLDDWFSGDLVQTMLVKAVENNPDACVPKNPSPARLRRVWETCRRFWTETVGGILEHYRFGGGDALRCTRVAVVPDNPTRWRENVPYDGTINGKAVGLLWQQNEGRFITIGNLQLGVAQARDEIGLVGEWHGRECTVTLPDRPGRTRTFTVKCVELLNGKEIRTYAPYLTLLETPDRCLTLVPVAEALDIARQIKDEYEKQMGKVQNRLPLFLGIVFFHRKTPLAAVMDAGRRMAEQVELREEEWRIEKFEDDDLAFQNGVEWRVPIKMGDGTTDDVWYPYFELVGAPAAHHTHHFERDGQWWVHVKNLQCGETVRVTPSRFAYIYLEHTAQRFKFDTDKGVMLLDELPRLAQMWCDLKQSSITDTGLRGVQALLETKAAAWGEASQELERLAATTLKDARLFQRKDKDGNPLPDIVIPEDVKSERFRRCLELHTKILKLRVKED